METRIVRPDRTGTCDMCGVTGMLYDVEDAVGDSLLNDTGYLCYSCAQKAQEMIWDEIQEEKRLEKILEKEKNGNYNC